MSDTVTNSDRLIRIIRGLMALSRNNPNQHEAEAAAAKVQDLLAEHNIEMAEIDNSTKTDATVEVRRKTPHDRSAMYNYQRSLMAEIARNNFCLYFVEESMAHSNGKMRKVKRHVLLGRQVNILGSILMYDYLVDTFDALLPYTGMEKRGKNALLWLDGCTASVVDRLADRRYEAEKASREAKERGPVGGNALTLANVYGTEADLNNDAINGREPGTTARIRHEQKARTAAYLAEMAEKVAVLVAKGHSSDDAYYLARGMTPPPRDVSVVQEKVRPETPRQREKRLEREARQAADYAYRQHKRNEKYYSDAYQAGKATGQNVGLDRQIDKDSRKGVK